MAGGFYAAGDGWQVQADRMFVYLRVDPLDTFWVHADSEFFPELERLASSLCSALSVARENHRIRSVAAHEAWKRRKARESVAT